MILLLVLVFTSYWVFQLSDTPAPHEFIVCGAPGLDGTFFAEFLPCFEKDFRKYHAIAKFKLSEGFTLPCNTLVHMRITKPMTLYHLLKEDCEEAPVLFFGADNASLGETTVTVVDLPRFEHFETPFYAEYPKKMKYFLYGDENAAFMSHCLSGKSPDFQQVGAAQAA